MRHEPDAIQVFLHVRVHDKLPSRRDKLIKIAQCLLHVGVSFMIGIKMVENMVYGDKVKLTL